MIFTKKYRIGFRGHGEDLIQSGDFTKTEGYGTYIALNPEFARKID